MYFISFLGLLGSFVDFFNTNSQESSTGDSFNASADGFSDFPPDPDFPPGPDPVLGPDTGPLTDPGLPSDTGFPSDSPVNVNKDTMTSGAANQNKSKDTGIPSGAESPLTNNQRTVTEPFPSPDLGLSIGQASPVDKTLSAPGSSNIGGNTISSGGLPTQPGISTPIDVNAQTGSLTPADLNAPGLPAQPESLAPADINAGGLPAQPTNIGNNNLPPFVIDSGEPQGGASQESTGPARLDFHFLPELPNGGNFVNLITGRTNTFQPTLGWIGDPGRPADISVEGPGSSGPLVDPAPVGTGTSNPDSPLTPGMIDVPTNTNIPPSNLPPEPPIAQPVEPTVPIDTKPPVDHQGPFFVDPIAAFFDTPADNQGPTQPDTTSLTDTPVSGSNQDINIGNQGGATSGSAVLDTMPPSGNDPGIFTLFDLNEIRSPSQSLANNKPAVLPFETPGIANPVETNVVQQKEMLPESWMQLYPEGRKPRRRIMGMYQPFTSYANFRLFRFSGK